jgi:hypothetical protein
VRHGVGDEGDGRDPDDGDEDVGGAPAVGLAEPGGSRHAEDVRDGDAEHDPPDGATGLAALGEVDGDEGGNPEERAVRQARKQPGPDEQAVVRSDG